MCIWHCELALFCVDFFMRHIEIFIHSQFLSDTWDCLWSCSRCLFDCILHPTNCQASMNNSLPLHPTNCWAENCIHRNQLLQSKLCIINEAGETTNSLLPFAPSVENLCDLVDIFASFFDIMFKRFYCFVNLCVVLCLQQCVDPKY